MVSVPTLGINVITELLDMHLVLENYGMVWKNDTTLGVSKYTFIVLGY